MDKIPIQWNKLWDAFKNIAIVFSFLFNLLALCAVILLSDLVFYRGPQFKVQVIKPKAVNTLSNLHRLENATITLNVPVSETIPVKFVLPVHARTRVTTTGSVPLNTSANFTLPGGGGSIRGSVSLALPPGLQLPVELYIEVPVSQTIPIQMEIPVSVSVKDTELGAVIRDLIKELEPFLRLLSK